jgi:hypothetical protein
MSIYPGGLLQWNSLSIAVSCVVSTFKLSKLVKKKSALKKAEPTPNQITKSQFLIIEIKAYFSLKSSPEVFLWLEFYRHFTM